MTTIQPFVNHWSTPSDDIMELPEVLPNVKQHSSPLATFDNLDLGQASTQADVNSAVSMLGAKIVNSEYTLHTFKNNIRNVVSLDNVNNNNSDYGDNYAKWRKLALVAKSINRFKHPRVERIKSEINLKKSIVSAPLSMSRSNNSKGVLYVTPGEIHNEALGTFRDQTTLFGALETASKKDFAYIKSALISDPKENLYDEDSPQRLVNRPNYRGYTPFYVACKNGNVELIELLLVFKANPYQLCKVSTNESETGLVVAARWGHLEAVRYLLSERFIWSEREVKSAYKEAKNHQIKRILKTKINKRSFLERFFVCSSQQKKVNYLA
jgi:hypothetical protein